jgi:hypothetical protein
MKKPSLDDAMNFWNVMSALTLWDALLLYKDVPMGLHYLPSIVPYMGPSLDQGEWTQYT